MTWKMQEWNINPFTYKFKYAGLSFIKKVGADGYWTILELKSTPASQNCSFSSGNSKKGENEDLVQMQTHSNEVWMPINFSSGLAALVPNSKLRQQVPKCNCQLCSVSLPGRAMRCSRCTHGAKDPSCIHNEKQILH